MKALQRRGNDAGFSLPELLVVMLLSSIVLAAVAVVFNGSMRVARTASAKGNTTGDARIAMDAMIRRLRVAVVPPGGTNPFGMAGTAAGTNYPGTVNAVPPATEVAFFASLTTAGSTSDPAPMLVDYSIDAAAKCLREKMTPASGTAPSLPGADEHPQPMSDLRRHQLGRQSPVHLHPRRQDGHRADGFSRRRQRQEHRQRGNRPCGHAHDDDRHTSDERVRT